MTLLTLFIGVGSVSAQEEGTYFLYNESTGLFLSRGATWGTRSTADLYGIAFELAKINDGVYTLKNVDHSLVANGNKYLGDNLYTDNGSACNYTFASQGNGYTISKGSGYLTASTAGAAITENADASDNSVWKLLTKTEYNTILAQRKNTEAASIANAAGFNDVTTLDGLIAKISDTNTFISEDCTSKVANANIGAGSSGWTKDNDSNRGAGDTKAGDGVFQSWNGSTNIYQTVSNLEEGIYKLSVQAFYRIGNSASAVRVADNGCMVDYLYAGNNNTQLVSWYNIRTDDNSPNSMAAAHTLLDSDSNIALVEVFAYVGQEGTLKIGINNLSYVENDWMICDNFKLTYYTDKVAEAQIDALIATIPENVPTAVATNLNTLKEALQSEKTIVAYNALDAAIKAANPIAEKYDVYKTVRDRMVTIKNQTGFTNSGDAATAFDAEVTAQNTAVEASTTVATIEAAIEAVRAAAGTFLGAVEITGTVDATALIMNDTPTSNGDFWALTGGVTFDSGNNVAEYWNQSGMSIKQLLYGLPIGYYTLTAVALTRTDYVGTLSAGENTMNIATVGNSTVDNRSQANTWFNNGNGVNALSFHLANAANVEIGITADNANGDHWTVWRNFKLEYFGTDPLAADKALYQEALANAQEVDDTYTVVTGEEATALDEALTTYGNVVANYDDVEGSKTALQEATAALNEAAQTVKDAAPSYEAYNAEKEKAVIIGLTDEIPAATNAAAAAAAVNTMKVAESTFVNTNYPADITSLVGDLSTWTGEGGTGTSNNQHWSGSTKTYYEQSSGNWGANAWEISYTKTVTLPAGKYMAKVAARGTAALTYSELSVSVSKDVMPLAHKGDNGKGIATDGTTSFDEGTFANNGNGRGWEWGYLPFELTEESEVTFTLASKAESSGLWVSYCDFALLNVLATAEDYTALEDAKPTDIVLGFEEGEYAPYNNIEAAAALELANGIDPEAANAQVAVQLATNTLMTTKWVANEEEVNAVHNGLFATVQEGANYPEGWTRTNSWGQMRSGIEGDYATAYYNQPGSLKYGNNGGYIMPLKANTTYTLKFAYRSHENNSNDGITVSVLNGEDGISGKTFPGNGSTTDWKTATMVFTTGAAGNYVLTLANGGNTWMTGVEIFKAQPVEIAIKAGRQYTAFSCEWPLDFANTGLTAQIVTSAKGATQDVTKVPANTGIIVGLAEPATENTTIQVPICTEETEDVAEANMLVAVVDGATIIQPTDYTIYVFGKKNGKEAFYKVGSNGITVPANNAYLAVPVAAGAKEVIFLGGETTGINNVDADVETGDLYNLSGMKVKKAQKGVYIQNGKKVIVK
ncbi:MAG: hypothetical protein IKW98_06195 [Prevotella sp.]|nr:hypothetical protein [Prevotella sp.]